MMGHLFVETRSSYRIATQPASCERGGRRIRVKKPRSARPCTPDSGGLLVEFVQEFKQQLIDLARTLLLNPMAASAEDVRAAQRRKRFVEVCDSRATPPGRAVFFAADEKRGHHDGLSCKCGEIFPIAIGVTITIESAGEPGPLK